MQYTDELESPDAYNIWCGLSALSTATRRNVWLNQGHYDLYPNLYVALVGVPGRTAKSTAINMSRRLVARLPNITFGPNSGSREDLIRLMAESKLDNKCCISVYSSELSSFLATSGVDMIQFLIDIYDCDYHPEAGWQHSVRKEKYGAVMNPCLNFIFGTTPTYVADYLPAKIGDGFVARTIFVYGDKERKINPRPKDPDINLIKALVEDLQHISQIQGEFSWTPKGMEVYDEFYNSLYTTTPDDYRMEGYHFRKKIHLLKLAMLISLSERDDLILDELVIEQAKQFLEDVEKPMMRTFSAVGKYEYASDLERIGDLIAQHEGGLPMTEVFQRNYFAGAEPDIRRILAQLHSMGAISLTKKGDQEWVSPKNTDQGTMPWMIE